MRKLRLMLVFGVVAAVLLLGTTVAQAGWGWWWNAQIDVEGTEVHVEWTVKDGIAQGQAEKYFAEIAVSLPDGAQAIIQTDAETEDVTLLSSTALQCTAGGVEGQVQYTVSRLHGGTGGGEVSASITADGAVIATGNGKLGKPFTVNAFIPTSGVPSCASQ